MTRPRQGRTPRALGWALLIVAVALTGTPGSTQSSDRSPAELQALCNARASKVQGSGEACYQLSLRYRDGRGVSRDPARAEALLEVACATYFRSDRACFTQCLKGKNIAGRGPACGALSFRSDTLEAIKRLLATPDLEGRSRVIRESRDLRFLRWVVTGTHEEITSIPQREELKEVAWNQVAQVALHDPDPGVRLSAVTDVTTSAALSFEELESISKTDPDPRVRQQAGRMLGHIQTQLGTPAEKADVATKHDDPEVRREAVARMGDQAALAKIALSDPDAGVRAEAVQILEDQKALARIAEKDEDDGVRQIAASGLRDQGALERLARRGRTGAIRRVAVEKVDNQAVVAWVAEHDGEPDVRFAAVKRTTDQAALERIARTEKIGEIRAAAIGKLRDPRVLVEIAVREADAWGYQAAIDRLGGDAPALRQILEGRWEDAGVVEHVARQATHDSTLALILERSQDLQPRLVAATRLKEPRLAAEALPNQRSAQVRTILVDKVDDRALLVRIARTDPDSQVRAAAARRLAEIE